MHYVAFDDPNLVSVAGLVPAMLLAARSGLHDLVAGKVKVPVRHEVARCEWSYRLEAASSSIVVNGSTWSAHIARVRAKTLNGWVAATLAKLFLGNLTVHRRPTDPPSREGHIYSAGRRLHVLEAFDSQGPVRKTNSFINQAADSCDCLIPTHHTKHDSLPLENDERLRNAPPRHQIRRKNP